MNNAGKLDRQIVIQQQALTYDASGGPVSNWETYKTVWANRRFKRTTERLESDQQVSSAVVEWEIRALDAPNVDASMQVVEGSDIYEIEGVLKYGREDSIVLQTKIKT